MISSETLYSVYFGNRVLDYFQSLGIILVSILIIVILKATLLGRLGDLAEKTKTSLDDFLITLIKKIAVPAAYFSAIYLALINLALDPVLKKAVDLTVLALVTIYVTRLVISFLNYSTDVYLRKSGKSPSLEYSFRGILRVLRIIIWMIAIAMFLDNIGYKISAVVAGLGIGGVAVALAAQTVLADLFSYFAILFDRPFEVGDFIIVGDMLGAVEKIGIKTTRISSLGGEQLIFSNTDLTNSRVRNYKRMKQRRVLFKLGVTYNTPVKKLQLIPGIIENIIKNVTDTKFDRAHFSAYGDFNLVVEVVYYVDGPDYNKYMDIQQQINFEIKKTFEEQDIDFAFPTQTLYVNKVS